jgi:hypothetical protein
MGIRARPLAAQRVDEDGGEQDMLGELAKWVLQRCG